MNELDLRFVVHIDVAAMPDVEDVTAMLSDQVQRDFDLRNVTAQAGVECATDADEAKVKSSLQRSLAEAQAAGFVAKEALHGHNADRGE